MGERPKGLFGPGDDVPNDTNSENRQTQEKILSVCVWEDKKKEVDYEGKKIFLSYSA